MLLQRIKPLWKEAVKDLFGQIAVINSIKIFLKISWTPMGTNQKLSLMPSNTFGNYIIFDKI
jgi:hypothetical protein